MWQLGQVGDRTTDARARRGARVVRGLLCAAALAVVPATASAQSGGDGFFFKPPAGSITLYGGFDHANAGSDIFSFTTSQLTVDRGDFSAPTVGVDLSFRLASRFDAVLGVAYAGRSTPSEFRDFVDQNDLPIQQTTTFQRLPVSASLKAYLVPRGRTIGHYAWVPNRYALYVGAGGGAMWYRFRQRGDFIDFNTNEVFSDTFASSGWTPEGHALAGLEISLSPRWAITTEGRYTWARATLGSDFSGFQRIDLSGVSATAGLTVRF